AQNAQASLAPIDQEAQELRGRLVAANVQFDEMQRDYQEVANRRVSWSQVYQAILTAGLAQRDLGFSSIQQRHYQVVVQGTGSSDASVNMFAQRLSQTGLFTSVVIQTLNEAPPGSSAPILNSGPPPNLPPLPTPTRTAIPVATATPTRPAAAQTPNTVPTITSVEWRVDGKVRTMFPGTHDRAAVIRVRLVDETNTPVRGQTVRLQGQNVRQDLVATDGTAEFRVETKGTYALVVVSGRSETATDLVTKVDNFTGYITWDVTFRRTSGSSAAALPSTGAPSLTGVASYRGVGQPALVRSSAGDGALLLARIAPPAPAPVNGDERPFEATYAFTIVLQVKPGAGQAPASSGTGSSATASVTPLAAPTPSATPSGGRR
ncbi:MAG: hypothetical protein NZ518_09680, partial [Dehalococcoidia bacterium]|nr:hypothetical protein [Dehalococcoidia bacterium]